MSRWPRVIARDALLVALGVAALFWATERLRRGPPVLEETGSRAESRAAREAWSAPRDLRGDPAPAGTIGSLGSVRLRHGGAVRAVAFSPDGRLVASASDDRTVSLWDARSGLETRRLPTWAPARAVAFSPDGSRLAAAASDDTAWLWDAHGGAVVARMRIPSKNPMLSTEKQGVAFSADGAALLTTSTTGVDRWSALDGRHEARLDQEPPGVFPPRGAEARSPDGQTVASGQGGRILLRHVSSGAALGVLEGHHGYVLAVAFSPDGTRLVSGGDDHGVRLWDLSRGTEEEAGAGAAGAVRALAFSVDGGTLVSAHADGSLRSWGRGGSRGPARAADEGGWAGRVPRVVSLSPSRLLVADGRRARVLDAETLATVEEIPFPEGSRGLAIAPAAGRIVVGGDDLRVFTLGSAAPRTIPVQAPEEPVAFSRDGRAVATFRPGKKLADHVLVLRDAETGQEVAREAHRLGGPHPAACASADGRHLLYNGSLQRVESGSRHPHLVTVAWPGRAGLCVVSPDGQRAAAREWDRRSVALFAERPGDTVLVRFAWLEGHRGDVSALALSPDGGVLATGGEDGSVLLWDLAEIRRGSERPADRPEPRWPPERTRAERGPGAEVAISFDEGVRGRGIDPVVYSGGGPVRLVDGRVGRAAVFEQGLELPETRALVLGDELTFATWFALPGAVPGASAGAQVVRSGLVSLDVRDGGRLFLFLHFHRESGHASLDLTPWTGGPVVAGRWYHVAVSYRRADGVPRVCVDGACGPGPRAFNYADRLGTLGLGGGWRESPPVALDELLVRDVALSDDEMAALAGQPSARPTPQAAASPGPPAEALPEPPLGEDVSAFVSLDRRAAFDVFRFAGPLSRVGVTDVEVAEGRVWAGTTEGLLEHDPRAGTWRFFGKASGAPGERMGDIAAVGGRVVADVSTPTAPGMARGLGTHVFDPERRAWSLLAETGGVWSLEADGDVLWMGTSRGAQFRYLDPSGSRPRVEEGGGRSFSKESGQLRHDAVLDIAWHAGTVWFAMGGDWVESRQGFEGGGVSVWDRARDRFTSYGPRDGLADGYVGALAVDEREAWAAHWKEAKGLSRFDRTAGRWEAVRRSANGIDLGGIALALDGDALWIGQQRGLVRLDRHPRAARRYQRSDGLPGHTVPAFAAAKDGLWAAAYGSPGFAGGPPGEAGLLRIPWSARGNPPPAER